jgi:hypothetical protein
MFMVYVGSASRLDDDGAADPDGRRRRGSTTGVT